MGDFTQQKDYSNGNGINQFSSAGSAHITDAVYLQGYSQANFAISAVGAQSSALTVSKLPGAGLYDVWADVDCFVKVSATDASDVTTSTGYLLRAGNTVPHIIPSGSKIGAITSGATGTLRFHRVA